jgi:O-antigen/teichoic acid export membrane protein
MSENQENKKKEIEKHLISTTKQSSIVVIGKFGGFLLGFITSFILAKFFGPKVVGQYSLVNTVVRITIIFTVFGLNNGLLKYISRYKSKNQPQRLKQIIKIAFSYGILFSLVGSVGIFFSRELIANNIFSDSSLAKSLAYGAWLIIPLTLLKLFDGLYRGVKCFPPLIISRKIVSKVLFILFIISLYFLNITQTLFVITSFLIAQVLVMTYLTLKTKDLGMNLFEIIFSQVKNLKESKKEFLNYCVTLIFISFMGVILSRIDKIMVGIYMSSEQVGIYSIGAKVAILVSFLRTSSNQVFTPLISELYSNNDLEMLEDLYSTITKWIIIFTLPVVITMTFFPGIILNFFGEEYMAGSGILIVLAIGHFITVLPGANGAILNMSGNEKLVLINNSILAIFNIFFNIIFIPHLGILGAALATTLSLSIVNIFKVIQVKFFLEIIPYRRGYFHIFINLCLNIAIASFMRFYWGSLVSAVLVTVINLSISLFISYQFKAEIDQIIFDKVKLKLKNIF